MTGWHCPGCDRCYAPSVVMCLYCGSERSTFTLGTLMRSISSDTCAVCGRSRLADALIDCPDDEHYGISWGNYGGAG